MRALVFKGQNEYGLEERNKPTPREEELLIKVECAGVCGTDWSIIKGDVAAESGVTLGHEFSGVVEEVGDAVDGFKVGDCVIGSPVISCGRCYFCRRGFRQLCIRRRMFGAELDGSFANFMIVPSPQSVLLVTPLQLNISSLIGDTFATGYHAAEMGEVEEDETVAIFGAGPIGATTAINLALRKPRRIFNIARSKFRLKAIEELGSTPINAREEDPVRRLKLETTIGVDVVYECAGSPATFSMALQSVRRGGRIVFASTMPRTTVPLDQILTGEIRLVGAFCPAGPEVLKMLVDFVEKNKIQSKLEKLITHYYPLSSGKEALEKSMEEDRMKILIKP